MPNSTQHLLQEANTSQWAYSFLISEQFVYFLNLIREAAILSDISGHIILTNTMAQTLFQYSAEEFLNCIVEDLVPEKIKGIHPKMRAAFFENPEPRFLEGREVGDLVLCEISKRLTTIARAEDLVARVGGDEFVFTIYPVSNPKYLDNIAPRISKECAKTILINNKTYNLSASIGISVNDTETFDEEALIKSADKAMYDAKKQGGNCFAHAKH